MENTNMEKFFSRLTLAIYFRLSRSGSEDKITFAKRIYYSIRSDPTVTDKTAEIKRMEALSTNIARQAFKNMGRYNILSKYNNMVYVDKPPIVKAIVSDLYAARYVMKASPNMVFKLVNSISIVRSQIWSRQNEPEWEFLARLWDTYVKEWRVALNNHLKDDDTQNAVMGLMKLKYGPQCTCAF